MVDAQVFASALEALGVRFFAGVPDSVLAPLISELPSSNDGGRHVVAANEGNAVALAAGHYLSTGRPACVYLQNSGLGNALNPLLSLCDEAVHAIPLLLLVGWRGGPGQADEPQHVVQGRVTPAMLEAAGLRYRVLGVTMSAALADLREMHRSAIETRSPSVLVIPHGRLSGSCADVAGAACDSGCMDRAEAIAIVDQWCVASGAAAFATTGHTVREIIALRGAATPPDRYFLNFGAMGHVSQLALGFALSRPDTPVLCIDGDGSALMHLGGLATIGRRSPANLVHVILNNRAHDSVGGFPACANPDFAALGSAFGYPIVQRANSRTELSTALERLGCSPGPALIEVSIRRHAGGKLARPRFDARDNKAAFMDAWRVPGTTAF